jgi:hypothetical protein
MSTKHLRSALQQVLDAWQPTDPTTEYNENRQTALSVLSNPDATEDELASALDEFTSLVPMRDWLRWSDELDAAMDDADKALTDYFADEEPQFLQGEID